MKDDFVIEWLRQYFKMPDLDEKDIKPVLHFSLLWNLFEYTYFDKKNRLNTNELLEISKISSVVIEDYCITNIFNYFSKRYLSNKKTNEKFEKLGLRKSQINDYQLCSLILLKENPSKTEKLQSIFLIVYRYRNNLFHGMKNPKQLNLYKDQFDVINQFLTFFIDQTSNNNTISKSRFNN